MARRTRYGARRRPNDGPILVAVAAGAALLIVAGMLLLPKLFGPREYVRSAADAYCAATTADGVRHTLTPEQASNTALIANIAVNRGLPDHAATVAIATAMQESRLTNLDYGDLDSLGMFQQRPSQGWGTAEQVTDMTYATNIFYDHLLKVPDWQTIPVEDAAQKVQRSGYPDLYANWDAMARAWAAGLTGEHAAGISCALEPASSSDADELKTAVQAALPNVVIAENPSGSGKSDNATATTDSAGSSSSAGSGTSGLFGWFGQFGRHGSDDKTTARTTLTVTLPSGLDEARQSRACWQAAGWLVTHAREYGIDAITANGMSWNRTDGAWVGNETANQSITITLAG
ncbi:cobalt transporter [Bifidobacterium sp. UTBIF-78]|uniref:cobalt transporter n=1 Tax=Bifidobacterium sp. UTBIF-78 TaxID=1465263 RepID=UPI001126319F|nr:cobalt transporter [Bifidobacterium sp. UTBIF-78]TPF95757.1 cobalt transporter [Bifidobacterium sp. UTBIF-78]